MSFTENVKMEPVESRSEVCLSTQLTIGFSEADARLYAGAPLLFHAARKMRGKQKLYQQAKRVNPVLRQVVGKELVKAGRLVDFALAQCVGDFDTPHRLQDNPTFVMLEALRYIEERIGRSGGVTIDDGELKTHLARVRPFLEGGA